jgi:N-acetylglucosamine kinase-like BadF-type ATPase
LAEAGDASGTVAPVTTPTVAIAALYFSGLDFPFQFDGFTADAMRFPWAPRGPSRLLVGNDMDPLLRAGTDEATAVAVVCGTGMNCLGRTSDGTTVRFGAVGDMSGDWGGGWTLGREAIWHSARAADGRGPATALEALTLRALGYPTMDEVIIAFESEELHEEIVRTLAPLIFEAAAASDRVALRVVERQAEEIVAFAVAALKRLGVLGQRVPVVLGGGVIAPRHATLLHAIDARLAADAPGAHPVIVTDPPLVGAGLLAFDALDAAPDVLARVRESLRRP